MYAGLKLFAVEDEDRVMCVLSYKDLGTLEGLLAKVDYQSAVQIILALTSVAEVQEKSGLTATVQFAVDSYRQMFEQDRSQTQSPEREELAETDSPPDETRH